MAGVGWPKGKKRGPRKPRIEHVGNIDPVVGGVPVTDGDEPAVTVTGDGSLIIDPAIIAGGSDTGSGGGSDTGSRRPGRKAKAKNKTTVNVSSVEMMLFSIHNMAASLLKLEELQMDESEAKTLAVAVAKVADQYDSIPGMSEKTAAWTNLAMVAGITYAPRVAAYRMRMMNEKDAGKTMGLM